MRIRNQWRERLASTGARRALAASLLLLAASCFASFEACTSPAPPEDPVSSSQPQALSSSGDPAGNRGGLGRTGEYIDNYLTNAQVSSTTFKRSPVAYSVDGPVYAQPVIAQNVTLTNDYSPRNLLIVATTTNHLYAFDADQITAPPVWTKGPELFGQAIQEGFNDLNGPIGGNPIGCYNLGNVGILSTPYIDTVAGTAYVVAESLPANLDAQAGYSQASPPVFTLYALDLATGAQKSQPVILSATSNGPDGSPINFNALPLIQRAALTPVKVGNKTFLLIAFASSCDGPAPYYGWIISADITYPTIGPTKSFCTTCGAVDNAPTTVGHTGGGIWQSGMGLAVDNNGNAYFQSGNGVGYSSTNPATYSNTMTKLTVASDGSMSVTGFFTPSNQDELSRKDLDLGVSGVAWLGASGMDGGGPNVLLSGSKVGAVYLADPSNLGGYNAYDNVLDKLQGSCDQFDPGCGGGGGKTYDPVSQPANCQGNVLQPNSTGFDPGANGGCPQTGTAGDIQDQSSWPHIHGAPVYWAETNYIYFMGQYDLLRRLKLNPQTRTFDTTAGDSFGVADAAQIAPTLGYGGLISISYNPVVYPNDGILWVSTRLPKEAKNWGYNTHTYTNTHAGAELSPGALYAVDARSMTRLFSDTPTSQSNSFLLSKFATPTIYSGRVYLATFSNEILVYCNDQDGDGICDTMDNCPTIANTDQANSNYDAERILPGKPVLGDACDPNATTSLSPLDPEQNGSTATDGVQVPCTTMLVGCGSSNTGSQAWCTRKFNTKLSFSAHIGNDAGTAPEAGGTTGPAFCRCTRANQYQCLQPTQGACDGAHDNEYPPLDGGVKGNWNAISQLAPDASAQWFPPIALNHVEPWNAYPGSVSQQVWDYPNDLNRFGGNSDAGMCEAGLCGLQGELWSHVISFTPGSTENGLVQDLNNNYLAATAQFLPVWQFQIEPCLVPVYQPWLWGQHGWSVDPAWMFPLSTGVGLQSTLDGMDISSSFTANALSIIEPMTGGGSSSVLIGSDGARGLGTSKVLAAVVAPITGAPGIRLTSALVQNGTQVDAASLVSGATVNSVPYAVIETLDSESGTLYALTQNGTSESLVAMDVTGALNNFTYAQTSVALSGTMSPRRCRCSTRTPTASCTCWIASLRATFTSSACRPSRPAAS